MGPARTGWGAQDVIEPVCCGLQEPRAAQWPDSATSWPAMTYLCAAEMVAGDTVVACFKINVLLQTKDQAGRVQVLMFESRDCITNSEHVKIEIT